MLLKTNPFVRQKLCLVLYLINFAYRVVSLEFQLRALDVVGAHYLLQEMNKWISFFFFLTFSVFIFPTPIGKDSTKGLKHRFLNIILFIYLAVLGLVPAAGFSLVSVCGPLCGGLSLQWRVGSRLRGFSRCGLWPLEHRLNNCSSWT